MRGSTPLRCAVNLGHGKPGLWSSSLSSFLLLIFLSGRWLESETRKALTKD